jgi:predicted dehydrogenase
MELVNGVTANLIASFEAGSQYIWTVEIHGTEGVLSLPDPNAFDGPVRRRRNGRGVEWDDVPYTSRGAADARGIGLQDMVDAIAAGQPHRATGRLGLHVVEVARGILRSADEGRFVDIESRLEQPAPLPVAEAV